MTATPPRTNNAGIGCLALVAIIAVLIIFKPFSGSTSSGSGPTAAPAGQSSAWRITVDKAAATTSAGVGGNIDTTITLRNGGTAASPGTKLQFSDIDDYADLVGCVPKCEYNDLLGIYTTLPGITAGGTETFKVQFIATKVGAAHWSVCVYDEPTGGEQVYCGELTTTIR